MRAHENLEVWKKGIDFVVLVYRITETFPKDERFGLISQLRRAAVSVPAIIAEGAARVSPKEKLHFISIAQGSLSEVETELIISQRLEYLGQTEFDEIMVKAGEIGRMMYGWSRHLRG